MESSQSPQENRLDFQIIAGWIEEGAKVLDLGCGDGTLLSLLIQKKRCHGTGIEIDEKAIYKCIEKGLSVSHGDIDTSLQDYSDKRFDYVILNESLQQILHPKQTFLESLRIGKKVIVGIPNFCHWWARLQMFLNGTAPITKELPDEWYNTPNLRFLSLKDFENFCRAHGIKIVDKVGIHENERVKFMRNLFAINGLYLLEK